MKLLKEKPLWPREDPANSQAANSQATNSQVNGVSPKRFVAEDLYSPSRFHREFGLPVINWKGRWFRNTNEGTVQYTLICYVFVMLA